MIQSPLEQFELIPLIPLNLGSFDISFTQSTLFMFVGIISFLLLFRMLIMNQGGTFIPNRWQVLIENIWELCMTLSNETIAGGKGQKYFPFVFVIFSFILVSNFTGMVPYSFTATSHLSITLIMAIMVFVGYHIIGVRKHGIRLLELYLPSGVSSFSTSYRTY